MMKLEGIHGTVEISRPGPRVVLVTYTGHDVGEFKAAPFLEMDRHLGDTGAFHVFIDGRESKGASVEVSGEWARWLGDRRERLASIHLLSASRVIQLSGNFVKRFAALGDKMCIHAAFEPFEFALTAAMSEGRPPSDGR